MFLAYSHHPIRPIVIIVQLAISIQSLHVSQFNTTCSQFNFQEDEYEIGSEHSDYLIFRYDGVSKCYHVHKLWSSVELTIHSAVDDKFKMKVADSVMELRLTSDKSHENAAGSEHLQDAVNHIIDAFKHCLNALKHFVFYHNGKSVILNPMCRHHFVKVWYYGTKPLTTFTVSVDEGSQLYIAIYKHMKLSNASQIDNLTRA